MQMGIYQRERQAAMRTRAVIMILMVGALLLSGCGKSIRRTYSRENVDLNLINRIAVLPLENNTGDKYVASRMRNALITQLLAYRLFDVVESGLVDNSLQEEALPAGAAIDLNTLKRLAQRLNVQAFMMGSVDLDSQERVGSYSYPVVSLTLKLVDASAGQVLWHSTGHRSGESSLGRFFGIGSTDAYRNADKLIKTMVKSIPK